MHKLLNKYLFLFDVGGLLYVLIELIWRGHSHWTMFILGGLCFIYLGLINEVLPWEMPLWKQILIGAAILLVFKVIDLKIPLTYIGSFAVFVILYMLGTGKGFDVNYLFSHIFGGGLMLGAWFMATDYVTTPITPRGQYVYGVCLGVLTAVFRLFGGSAEGVSYAIIFCNLLVPMIERVTRHPAFGKGGKKLSLIHI